MDFSSMTFVARRSAMFLFTCLFLSVGSPLYALVQSDGASNGEWWYANGVLVIEFSSAMSKSNFTTGPNSPRTGFSAVDELFGTYKVTTLDKMFYQTEKSLARGDRDLSNYYRVTFDTTMNLDDAVKDFSALPLVVSVEKVGVHPIDAIPNDASFNTLWGLHQTNDRDIDAPEAWEIESGDSSILVGAMDTGVQWQHPDLAGATPYINGNVWINWTEYNGFEGEDDDGNGYVDDIRGWDWVDVSGAWPGEDGTTPDNNPMDFNGHGTHTSGTMAAITNNSIGVAGVAGGWLPTTGGCRVVPLRIGWSQANATGGETGYVRMDFAAQAFNYATQIGVTAVNCSWGSSNSGGISTAVDNALANGMVIVTSAGNSGNTTASYLAARTDIISVASLTSTGAKSSFSNYGTWVDVSAPGSSINSTYSNHGTATYGSLSGTSMASPHVAGLAGLLRSKVPGLTSTEVRDIIIATAENIDAQNPSYVGLLGSGRINALAALQSVFSAQASADVRIGVAPLSVNFTGSSASVISTWMWHFGDGDSASGQNVSHEYVNPGAYDVSLRVAGPEGEATENLPAFIVVHADTVEFIGFTGVASDPLVCDVRLKNFAPITSLRLPITYAGNMNIALDSVSYVGTRASDFTTKSIVSNDPSSKRLTLQFTDNEGGIPVGDDILFRMHFRYNAAPPVTGLNIVDTTRYSTLQFSIATPQGSYAPAIIASTLNVSGGLRGDANLDGVISVSDPVYLINYIFAGGAAPPVYNGDADANAVVNVSDAVYLIAHIFNGGPPPPQ